MPDITLNSVDLPAPLGPINATICPKFTSKLTSWTALRPPKCLATSSTRRQTPARVADKVAGFGASGFRPEHGERFRGFATVHVSAEIPGTPQKSRDAGRRIQNDQEEAKSIDQEFVALGSAGDCEQPLDRGCPHQRTEDRTGAADHQHRQCFKRGIHASAIRAPARRHNRPAGSRQPRNRRCRS